MTVRVLTTSYTDWRADVQHLPSTMRDVASGTLTELLGKLDTDELRRGKQFEKIVKWWLQNDAARTRNIKIVWLWDEWPDRPGRDIGVDLVAEMLDGSLCAIQAKCFNADRDIPKSEIDSFISAASPRTFAQRWLVATTNGLSANARRTIHDNQVTFVPLAELDAAVVTWPSRPESLKAVKKPVKAKPRPHQQRAIRDVLKGLKTSNKGQLIMACGTGKTLTALWITERLDSNTTLVLVPSLNLLSQTLTEWAHNTSTQWSYICVCSDDTVNKEDDQPINTTVDLPYPVTTKPSEIAKFLKRKGRKIIFSTYQSSAQVAKAQKLSGKKFDLTICDEAHRLTGKTEADYATVLDEKKIISKKRLFMTATPRTYTANVKAKAEERGVEITSMDDPHVYGPQFHRLTFGEAIKQELLTDYQVVIVGVTDPQVQELIDRRELVSVNNTVTTDARTLAAHIGLAKATKDFNLARTISFHSRIKTAAQFANDHPKILEWLPTTHKPEGSVWTDTISGDMNTGQRRILLQQLRQDEPGRHALLTNARCLTEGVDVPTLDGVAFIDPRSSQIDIVQAVGRAIRQSSNKKFGFVILSVLIPTDKSPEETISSTNFKTIWDVLNALRSHDERFGAEIDRLRQHLGQGTRVSESPHLVSIDLPEDIERLVPGFDESFLNAIVIHASDSWHSWFGKLSRFAAEYGHSRPSQLFVIDGFRLGSWVNGQRQLYQKGLLSPDRASRLAALPNWSWSIRFDDWQEGLAKLKEYVASNGHARVPPRYKLADGYKLGQWVYLQRAAYRQGTLDESQISELSSVSGWIWNGFDSRWEIAFERLKHFYESNGHYEIKRGQILYFAGLDLGGWVVSQRSSYRKQSLSKARADRLSNLPNWKWEPDNDRWWATFRELELLARKLGNPTVPNDYQSKTVTDLQRWTGKQRTAHKRQMLSSDRVTALENLPGWSWSPHDASFEVGFQKLKEALRSTPIEAIGPRYVDESGFRLGLWLNNLMRRHLSRQRPIDSERIERLLNLVPDLLSAKRKSSLAPSKANRHNTQFELGCKAFRSFVSREGHASIPSEHLELGIKLHAWVTNRRQDRRKGRLSQSAIKSLSALPMWSWDPFYESWNAHLNCLQSFQLDKGHTNVPYLHVQNGLRLGAWVAKQQRLYASGQLSPERIKAISSTDGWRWKSPVVKKTRTKSVPNDRRNQ
jgi:superfamily II DNA or RNA helicase